MKSGVFQWRSSDGTMRVQRLRFDDHHIELDGPIEQRGAVDRPLVGNRFAALVKQAFDVQECAACAESRERMNTLGPDGCEREKDAILEEIWERRDQLKGWKWLAAKFPGAKQVALARLGELFDRAIADVRQSGKMPT